MQYFQNQLLRDCEINECIHKDRYYIFYHRNCGELITGVLSVYTFFFCFFFLLIKEAVS